jgi:hypothetical protein
MSRMSGLRRIFGLFTAGSTQASAPLPHGRQPAGQASMPASRNFARAGARVPGPRPKRQPNPACRPGKTARRRAPSDRRRPARTSRRWCSRHRFRPSGRCGPLVANPISTRTSPTSRPIRNEPVTLMIRMPQGKFVPNSLPDPVATRYRATEPIAPPTATARTNCGFNVRCSSKSIQQCR